MNHQTAESIRRYFMSLDRQSKLIALLRYADDLSPDEIAAVLDVPMTRVEATLDSVSGFARSLSVPVGSAMCVA